MPATLEDTMEAAIMPEGLAVIWAMLYFTHPINYAIWVCEV